MKTLVNLGQIQKSYLLNHTKDIGVFVDLCHFKNMITHFEIISKFCLKGKRHRPQLLKANHS